MTRGQVLERIGNGLNADKLAYYVRARYLNPKKIKYGNRNDNDFSEEEVRILEIACKYMNEQGVKTNLAFEKAKEEIK